MEKQIIRWSYWLGVVSAALALLVRALNALGIAIAELPTRGNSIGYHSFLRGAILLLATAIATANFA